jgi:hypothetical protein
MIKNWLKFSIISGLFISIVSLCACQKEQKPKIAFNPIYLNELVSVRSGFETYYFAQNYAPPIEEDSIPNKTLTISANDEYSILVVGLDSTRILDFVAQTDSTLIFNNKISDYVYSILVFELTYHLASQKASYHYQFAYNDLGAYNHQTTRKFYEY